MRDTVRIDPLRALVERLEAEDPATAAHGRAIGVLAARIGAELRLGPLVVEFLDRCGLIHDIGKLYVPRELVHANRALSAAERVELTLHVVAGERALAEDPELDVYREAVRSHHERWDGRGYPDRLRGPRIPLHARILAVADAYDAMTGQRAYRFPLAPDRALVELERGRGSQFDPEVVDALAAVIGASLRPLSA
jgi:HD-GYP domain-containing protein (c-di-GMP phosphodiesterase class II)